MGYYTDPIIIIGIEVIPQTLIDAHGGDAEGQEEFYDWIEDNDLTYTSPYHDCDTDRCGLGFEIKLEEVLNTIKISELQNKFKKLTNLTPKLIHTVNCG